jgi:hypothetical protein
LDIETVDRGPDVWSWLDHTGAEIGYQKWFILDTSDMPDAVGYPLLTVKQTLAPSFDCWVSFSQLITGLETGEIAASVALVMANHTSAIEGAHMSISEMLNTDDQAQQQYEEMLEKVDPEHHMSDDRADKGPPKGGWN